MTELTLFMVVFSLQIILLSAYFPSRILARARYIQQNYPASTHPRLYPQSPEFFNRTMTLYFGVNAANFVLGWVILYFIYTGDLVGEEGINPMLPWGYFMLQMIPSQLLEWFGFRMAKLMKQQDQRTVKTAQLKPRRLTDHVSPMLLAAVVLSYVGFVFLGLFLENFEITSNSKTLIMSGILLGGFMIFWLCAWWLIKGKTKDPYQSSEDRQKTVRMAINTFCFTLIACCGFMALTLLIEAYELKAVMPIMMSLFLQLLVIISMGFMLNKCRVENIDFDVYRAS